MGRGDWRERFRDTDRAVKTERQRERLKETDF